MTESSAALFDFNVNKKSKVTVINVGNEVTPIIVIDQLCDQPEALMGFAEPASSFGDGGGFYPGIRKPLPDSYAEQICLHYLPLMQEVYQLDPSSKAKIILSALSLAVTPAEQLRPIQTLPHFDTEQRNQFALVHYLCGQQHGGTSFYRHRKTGYESITNSRLSEYGTLLKQQAIKNEIHKKLSYINSDHHLFERIHKIDAKMNKAIIYPSNLLHSGNINTATGLPCDVRCGRLTTSSFILIQ